ncbi:unnamed protein product [Protopolystoma xenopodis]|uniref:Tetraspanin n=1 Tax=Protopolystoma xenopodis TaxID=117903 RepID=A0A448WQK2_9PLAT|nr:unnamed protein product [Protopolystoma xenopodis]
MCVKMCFGILLALANLALAAVGLLLCTIGSLLSQKPSKILSMLMGNEILLQVDVDSLAESMDSTISVWLILVGLFMLVTAVLGMVAGCCRINCILSIYIILITIQIVLCGILIFVLKNEVKWLHDKVELFVMQLFNNSQSLDYYSSPLNESIKPPILLVLHQFYNCCALYNLTVSNKTIDYSNWTTIENKTCCYDSGSTACLSNANPDNSYVAIGCGDILWRFLVTYLPLIIKLLLCWELYLVGLLALALATKKC